MVDQGAASRSSEGGVIVTDPMAGEALVMQSPGLGGHHGMKLPGDQSSSSSSLSSGGSSRFEHDHHDEVINGSGQQHMEAPRPTAAAPSVSTSSSSSSSSIMDISPGSLFAFHPEQPNFFSQKSHGSSENPPHTRPLSVDSAPIPNIFSFSQMESELSHIDGMRDNEDTGYTAADYHHRPQAHDAPQGGAQPIGKPPRARGLFSSSSFDAAQMGARSVKTPPALHSRDRTFGGFPSAEGPADLLVGGSSSSNSMSPAHFHSADGLPHSIPTAGGARPMMKQHGGGPNFMYNHHEGGHPAATLPLNVQQQQQQQQHETAVHQALQQEQRRGGGMSYMPGSEDLTQQQQLYAGTPNGAMALPGGGGVGPRVYFQGYDANGSAMLAVSAHPQGGGLVTPTHFVTAAGMVPINQLMPFHMMRTLGSPMGSAGAAAAAGVPLESAMAYAAGPGIPFFVQASPHALGAAARLYSGDSRDGSPDRHGKDEDWHYGGPRSSSKRHDGFRGGDHLLRGDKRNNNGGAKKRVERDPDVLAALNSDSPSLEEILKSSSVHSLSQDQVGCRFLQLKLDETGGEAASVILAQAKPYLGDMMTDPFGNYLFQKILEKVTEGERTNILSCVRDQLVDAALNLHGTRSVQRLVELCKTDEQLDMIKHALRRDVVRLCVDANGNHVIQRALQHLGPDDRGFIFDAVSSACCEVSTHRHGCCVMQRCLDAATPEQKRVLVMEVGRNCFQLMQDPYGNYVVQYVLDRCHGEEIRPVTSCPIGRIASLSVQKYSSNVIEKCLEKATEDIQSAYIEEMCIPGNIKHLMQDQYANYVVQRALSVASHGHGMQLVESIRPHLHSMRNTAGGRRIVAKIVKRFPSIDLGSDFGNLR